MNSILTDSGAFVVGCNYWASHAGTNMWHDWRPDIVEADLQQLSESGLQVLRVFPLWPDFQPITWMRGGHGRPREIRFGEDLLPDTGAGQAGISEEMMERFRAFADLAHRHHIKLIVGLLTGWMSGRMYVPPALEGCNPLTDPTAILWETRFVRYFVRQFTNHPAVIAWDLGNECNVMGPVADPAEAYAWVAAITGAIRREDPAGGGRPIVSGLHGDIDTWQPALLGELTDLLTTHPYPVWTEFCDQDPVNTIRTILHSTSETRLYADLGRAPCIAEELGTLGPMLGSEKIAADFVRACLFSLWASDCHGLLWWCAYDQEHLAHAPYDWNTCERELGLITSSRRVKPALEELGKFRAFLDGLPIRRLPERLKEAVCILTQDTDHWKIAYSTFILAKQAGFEIAFQKAEAPIPDAPLYLMPSVKGVNVIPRHRWLELLEKVRMGAALYISMDDALLSEFREISGMEIQTRERRTEPITIIWEGINITSASPFRLALQLQGASVLAMEPDGNPAFTCYSFGQGRVYFLAAPIERVLTETPGAFHRPGAQPFWQVYQKVAENATGRRAVRKNHPMLGITEHFLEVGRRLVIAINYSPETLEDQVLFTEGWALDAAWRGHVGEDGRVIIPANDALVFTLKK